MRVSPPRIFPGAARAPRPAAGDPGADAHRQTGFVLGREVDLALSGLALEGGFASSLSGARTRTQGVAAVLSFWSRSWLTRLDALHALEVGNYVAAAALVRAAADAAAAEIAMLATGAEEWQGWIDSGGVALAPEHHALQYRLYPFRSAETLAGNPALGELYRSATELALPHFGSTLLLVGNASDANRVAVTFGDRDFHLGLAELCLGFLLDLGSIHVEAAVGTSELFDLSARGEDAAAFRADVSTVVGRPDRCRIEHIESDEGTRTVVHNFRRAPSGAPTRIVL